MKNSKKTDIGHLLEEWFQMFDKYISTNHHLELLEIIKDTDKIPTSFIRLNFFTELLYDMNDVFENVEQELDSISAVKLERVAQKAGFYPLTNDKMDRSMWIPYRNNLVDMIYHLTSVNEEPDYGKIIQSVKSSINRMGVMERALLKAHKLAKDKVENSNEPKTNNEKTGSKGMPLTEYINQKGKRTYLTEPHMVEFYTKIRKALKYVNESQHSRLIVDNRKRKTSTLKKLISISRRMVHHIVTIPESTDTASAVVFRLEVLYNNAKSILELSDNDYQLAESTYPLGTFVEIFKNLVEEESEHPYYKMQIESAITQLEQFADIVASEMMAEIEK